jgi:hypothetical protein
MPVLDISPNINSNAPGTLVFYQDGQNPSTGFQVDSSGNITTAGTITSTATGGNSFTAPLTVTGNATGQRDFGVSGFDTTSSIFAGGVVGDSFDRVRWTADGVIHLGPGTGNRDTSWQRIAAAQIGTNDSDLIVNLAGKGLRIKEGTNARQGTATLSAGTVTVANTSVTANTRIYLGQVTPGGTVGAPFVSAVTAGTGFTIKSTSSTDTSVVSYLLVEAA